jgi:hypothetical protein
MRMRTASGIVFLLAVTRMADAQIDHLWTLGETH